MIHSEMPLVLANCGTPLTVRDIRGGKERCRRLAGLGIYPGSEVEVVQKGRGPVILNIRGSRLAIGQGLAGCIMV